MKNYNSTLQTNNTDLQTILNTINELPEAGNGIELPELSNEGSVFDLLIGKELIDSNGNIIIGTMPNNNSVSQTLDTLITSYTIPEGYHDGSGTVSITTETKLITPTKDLQAVSPADNKVLSFVTVEPIPNEYQDVSEVTATASDVLSGKKIVDNSGAIITGAIATKTSNDLTESGATVTVPSGYYASQVTKSVAAATQATPSIAIDTNGLITASATQSAGYVSAGIKSATKQLTTQAAKTITPTKSSQTAVASGVYTTGTITVGAIPTDYIKPTSTMGTTIYTPTTANQTISSGTYCSGIQIIKGDINLKAENIRNGITIFGITGTYTGEGPIIRTIFIGGREYRAEENMTWERWIASDYNTSGFAIDSSSGHIYMSEEDIGGFDDIRLYYSSTNQLVDVYRNNIINFEDTYYFQGRT